MNGAFIFGILLNGIHFKKNEENATWHVTSAIIAVMVLMVLSNISFFRTAFRDPGIIPKMTDRSKEEIEKYKPYKAFETSFAKRGLRIFYMQPMQGMCNSKQITYVMKYCFTCDIYKPFRATHCGICGNCVHGFDHHCLWLGTCIGGANYMDFAIYITCL